MPLKCINCHYEMNKLAVNTDEFVYWCPACGTFIVLDDSNFPKPEDAGWQTPFLSLGCGTKGDI